MESTLNTIQEIYEGAQRDLLVKAYEYTKSAHANQKRASGEPYFIHPCAVADILMGLPRVMRCRSSHLLWHRQETLRIADNILCVTLPYTLLSSMQ